MATGVKKVMVSVLWDDLPGDAEVTGKAWKNGGTAGPRDEQCDDVMVLDFRRMSVDQVRSELAELGTPFDRIVLDDFRAK